jgi:hypothetical protein
MVQKKWAEAEPLAKRAIALHRELKLRPTELLARESRLALIEVKLGKADEAQRLVESILHDLDATPVHDWHTGYARVYLARVEAALGDQPRALQLLHEAVDKDGAELQALEIDTAEELAPLRGTPAFAALQKR